MATPTFCCGFECGTANAHWALSGSATFSTTVFRSGLRSLRVNPTATQSSGRGPIFAAGIRTVVYRFYRRFDTLPGANCVVAGVVRNADGFQFGLAYQQSDAKFYAGSDDGITFAVGATGAVIIANDGMWHKIDIRVDATANPHLIDVSIDDVALGQHSKAVAAADLTRLIQGNINRAVTYDIYDDDVLQSATSGDYPLLAGFVQGFVPNADGTHTFTTTIGVRGTTVAPTGGGNIAGSTDAFNWLNARPIGGGATDATRLWNQQSNGSTLYGEVQFEDYDGLNAPRAVEALCVQLDASTGTGDSTFKLNDNGTESTIFATGAVAGVTSDTYRTKQYATAPSTGAAWTLALFNGLKFRFGYSADANPDHYCRGVMIEAEFPTDHRADLGRPYGHTGQQQMQQLLAT